MLIRKATQTDSQLIAEHMLLAMQDIVYEFIGIKDTKKAKEFLLYFVEREDNQYSYANCFVAVLNNEHVGTINIYDGETLEILREPIAQYIKEHFRIDFNPENETQPGEYYIDTIGISPQHQGKGIGTHLLKFIIETYHTKKQQTIGLLVDENNPNAEKLYLNLGFKFIGKKVLIGKQMRHLQLKP